MIHADIYVMIRVTFVVEMMSKINDFFKGPFIWKEDDPSARIIFGLGLSERGMFSTGDGLGDKF